MCVSRDEDVDIQLPLEQRQTGHVAPRDHLMAVDETDLKLAHRHHLLLRVVQVLRGNVSCEERNKYNEVCALLFSATEICDVHRFTQAQQISSSITELKHVSSLIMLFLKTREI